MRTDCAWSKARAGYSVLEYYMGLQLSYRHNKIIKSILPFIMCLSQSAFLIETVIFEFRGSVWYLRPSFRSILQSASHGAAEAI